MAYDTEEQIKVIFQSQRAIVFDNLQVDESKAEYFKMDESLENEEIFAEDAGQFSQLWHENNENQQPSPDMIQ